MKVPYSWLKELLPEAPDPEATAELLASLGLGVEALELVPGAPTGVVVCEIETLAPISGSDTLRLATVVTPSMRRQVVTGAPNVRVGMRSALAVSGQALPSVGEIREREVMGVASEGMLLSPRELGLFDYGGGILELGEDAEVGLELARAWQEDTIVDLELTPNRADCFSILGVARDLAAKLGTAYLHPATGARLSGEAGDTARPDRALTVVVDDPFACPRFTLRAIDNVTVGPSPIWLQRRLALIGLRPINSVVDVTNYVTHELGQPSHAYDVDALFRGVVAVRRARAGESMEALNEQELKFTGDDLVIATPDGVDSRPIGVAGVIGGLHDSVSAGTRSIALEVAHFDPVTVRRTAKRLGLSTDASIRFERGVDPNLPPVASERAAQLIEQIAGGSASTTLIEQGHDAAQVEIDFRPSRVAFLMGMEVPSHEQRRYLQALGFSLIRRGDDDWRVRSPSWRFDMRIEEDLIEEVSRLHGFDQIPVAIPAMHFVPNLEDVTHYDVKAALAAAGFQETITYVFTSDEELERAKAPPANVRLASPQGRERSVLRTALYPGLLASAAANPDAERLALFEVGRVFSGFEQERLAVLVRGPWLRATWREGRDTDFYLFKGLLQAFAELWGARLELSPEPSPALHPGVSAAVFWNSVQIGIAGRIHPEVERAYELADVYVAELDMPLSAQRMSFTPYPRQPYAERDLAVVAAEGVPYATLEQLVQGVGGGYLETLTPFDVYRGRPISEGRVSIALRLRFRHPERSLRDEEVDGYMENVITELKRHGYAIRE